MAEEKKLKKTEEPDPEMLKNLRLLRKMDLYLMVKDLKLAHPQKDAKANGKETKK